MSSLPVVDAPVSVDSSPWDVVVIGAGAAGLLAATRAAERGLRTLLLEKNRRPGVKILMSGGTRCNLTQDTDARGIIAAYGTQGRFLHSALAALGPSDLVELIEAEGVPTKVEETGKIFPVSDRALDVQLALLRRLKRSGAELRLETGVAQLTRQDSLFEISLLPESEPTSLFAREIIITVGGQSYPGSGSTGDGYAWARALGHRVTPLRPALVPLTTSADWIPPLKGLTLPDVTLTLTDPGAAVPTKGKQRPLAQGRGSLLLTHFGLSGPVAMNLSREISSHPHPEQLRLTCDLTPDISAEQWQAQLHAAAAQGGSQVLWPVLESVAPRRFLETLLQLAQIPTFRKLAELRKVERQSLLQMLKQLPLPLQGTLGYEKAEVTAGGVTLDEVDSRTMASKLVPGIYWAGEVLDLDGPIGGYNFQAAFSTGWLAGESAGKSAVPHSETSPHS